MTQKGRSKMKNQNTGLWNEGGNNRRQFLKLAGYGTLGLISAGLVPTIKHLRSKSKSRNDTKDRISPRS